ncbi:abc transporter family protein [Stylonychia lemnae]|uniref:Abc transporter family protein n=1 Tax=Stylonychia lemnae TaxID=5949 RepID=A0A078AW86_STYLE|nr:abc transporter family protein [Stylonychia lemnae]|eukprot:CDW85063.1 abc transporter family protein [Stylonychia lemnae]
MGLILMARIQISKTYKSEQDFYYEKIVTPLRAQMTDEQWAIVGPVFEEELKFPKVNFMMYPFYYGKGKTADEAIQYEEDNYSFLGYQAGARNVIDPSPCIKRAPLRSYIGLFPKDNYTEMIERQLKIWMFQLDYSTTGRYAYENQIYNFNVLYFDSEEQMLEYVAHPDYEKDQYRPGLCAGISHYPKPNGEGHSFKIHMTDQLLDDRKTIPSQSDPAADKYNTEAKITEFSMYNKYFYTYFHNWLANAVLREVTGIQDATIVSLVMQMKIGESEIDSFDFVISFLMPICVTLMYIMPMYRMIMRIVSEKQTKIREVMRMMGLSDFNYWLSWFIFYSIVVTIISLVSTGIICSIFIQSFFTTPRTASIISILIYFFTSFADYAVKSNYLEEYRKILASILPTIAMSRAIDSISSFEKAKVGLQTSNMVEVYNNYKVLTCYYMFGVGLVLSFLTGIYLTNVLPTTADGLRKDWYYPVTRKYWCGTRKKTRMNQILNESSDVYAKNNFDISESKELERSINKSVDLQDNPLPNFQTMNANDQQNNNGLYLGSHRSPRQSLVVNDQEFESRGMNPLNYEPVNSGFAHQQETQQKILKIQNLQKTYKNGFSAVKGLNIKMYNGQIFALLGHNGAGKSTTISMLTGLISSTLGNCEVFGYDMFDDIDYVRQFLGVCPQHDILFDLLTPEEHLDIFSDFKGVSSQTKKEEIQKMLLDCDVYQHKDKEARNLSGGNKRKLSVAIAMIGGSRLVLLDEPTAGMDLSARRKLWNMLKSYKQNRIIILTTHYMDEADILGDRIGIMTGVKKNQSQDILISQYLEEKLGYCKKLSEISSEVTFQIPQQYSVKFKDFFNEFDYDLDKLNIRSYGISVTTLEEVFLKVGHGDDTEDNKQVIDELRRSRSNLENEAKRNDYSIANDKSMGICSLFFLHIGALFKKRFILYKRNYKSLISEIFVPVALVILGFGFSKIQFFINSPERTLSYDAFPAPQRLVVNSNLIRASGNDFSPKQIMQSLPGGSDQYEITYKDYSQLDTTTEDGEKVFVKKFDADIYDQSIQSPKEPISYGSYFVYQADKTKMQFRIASQLNLKSQDASALYPQFLYESILKLASNNPNYKFEVSTQAFPVTYNLSKRSAQVNGIFIVFVISIGFALIPASVISFIVHEREKNLKHMQIISGMSLPAYWLCNFTFDIIKSLIPSGIVVGLMYTFGVDYPQVWILLLLYPFAVIPFTYATSFFFNNENMAQTVTIFLHFFGGGIGAILVGILRIIESTYSIGDQLRWALKIFPSFCLTDSIMYQTVKSQLFIKRPELNLEDFEFQAVGANVYVMGGHFFFWTIVLIIIELRIFRWIPKIYDKIIGSRLKPIQNLELDSDVIDEEERIEESNSGSIRVRVKKFRKVYARFMQKPFLAVERTSFGLDYGECFALLGVNGAGKTTTFKSLTGEIQPTNGEITINGMDIGRDFAKIRKQIGYCPQHDAIFDQMSVEEHLQFYAKIKGIRSDLRVQLIEQQIVEMSLQDHRMKLAGTLSGGNKRKLSVAMCVIGNPPIILLDEPSAGMDPEARRFMWTVVSKISQQRQQSAVILTTHSMEEAEALSTKMGIMVRGGVFRCFGSSQHIKNKFGTGYEIEVKVRKLTQEDLNMKRELYGLYSQDRVEFSRLPELMRSKMVDESVINELDENGLGQDLVKEAQEYMGTVSVKNFLNWLYIEQAGINILDGLSQYFSEVEILEHYNDYYKLRVPRESKTIGFIFSFIENKKDSFKISEYSASQTTLEQIFQKFANQQIDNHKTIMKFKKLDGMLTKVLSQNNRVLEEKALNIDNQELSDKLIRPEQ